MSPSLFLTGATGFLGSNLLHHLEGRGLDLWAGVRGAVPEHQGEVRWVPYDPVEQLTFGPETTLVHLAARAHKMRDLAPDPRAEFFSANCDFTLALAQRAKDQGAKRFVFISSVKVMGDRPGFYRLGDPPAPEEPYGESKWAAEQGLQKIFGPGSQTECVILRLPMVYGPGAKGNVLTLLKAAKRGLALPLAGATQARSMLFVGNFLSALDRILATPVDLTQPVKTYFLTDGKDLTSGAFYAQLAARFSKRKALFLVPKVLLTLAALAGEGLGKVAGRPLPLNFAVLSRLFEEYRFDPSAFATDFRWTAPFTPEQGLLETAQWYHDLTLET
ncbi:MAG: hypothetical protein A2600_01420 [Candidatus Lambdaproteobacteria bacterium RIFOXYD1_FULL_56_27]|uniref:NAD-dependent epimerase/dehydratase domain-containing protein n=1 Tax=Candidatus Lambdaproteobacteria bacterium RIFOXYD2_FULL_56_26 TaxID=1817773 RepID=A0A1F6GSP6_9PROT|nr:MAG: hypothetical protein A2557_00535 [Candidatus Lambdaproteobacteria bacterium RIFOXYD2_FULL_56_26]OGH01393.1 MAG: hypothetical protein A2426_13370 [Candidatus Lambdaproteobacteria bacterium RIFOXYC1_FULL_56_13]OGH06934.1 MAG: hypothetical protein A2600_01420 [Candidatus Lambdaproteobacteria bacterium RIFOXYD1_FULL_56_27]